MSILPRPSCLSRRILPGRSRRSRPTSRSALCDAMATRYVMMMEMHYVMQRKNTWISDTMHVEQAKSFVAGPPAGRLFVVLLPPCKKAAGPHEWDEKCVPCPFIFPLREGYVPDSSFALLRACVYVPQAHEQAFTEKPSAFMARIHLQYEMQR